MQDKKTKSLYTYHSFFSSNTLRRRLISGLLLHHPTPFTLILVPPREAATHAACDHGEYNARHAADKTEKVI